jgi:hypothetical protein
MMRESRRRPPTGGKSQVYVRRIRLGPIRRAPKRPWAIRPSLGNPVFFGHVFIWVVRFHIVIGLLPFRQFRLLGRGTLIGDLAQEVGDDVQPRAPLVV